MVYPYTRMLKFSCQQSICIRQNWTTAWGHFQDKIDTTKSVKPLLTLANVYSIYINCIYVHCSCNCIMTTNQMKEHIKSNMSFSMLIVINFIKDTSHLLKKSAEWYYLWIPLLYQYVYSKIKMILLRGDVTYFILVIEYIMVYFIWILTINQNWYLGATVMFM